MLRFHMGSDRNIGVGVRICFKTLTFSIISPYFQEPKKKDEMDDSDQGLSILFKLFTEGSYQLVLEKIFSYFDGPDLVALQLASSKLQSFIQVKCSCHKIYSKHVYQKGKLLGE